MPRTTRLAAAVAAAALAVLPLASAPAQAASVADTVITPPLPAPRCVTVTQNLTSFLPTVVVRNGCAFTVKVRVVWKQSPAPSPCLTLAPGASRQVAAPSWGGYPYAALCTYGPYGD